MSSASADMDSNDRLVCSTVCFNQILQKFEHVRNAWGSSIIQAPTNSLSDNNRYLFIFFL